MRTSVSESPNIVKEDLTNSGEVYGSAVTVISVYSNEATTSSHGQSGDPNRCTSGIQYYVQDDTSVESDWDFDDRAEQSFEVGRPLPTQNLATNTG